jgi:hypothetical protein
VAGEVAARSQTRLPGADDGLEPFHAHRLTHQVEGQTVGPARRRDLKPDVPPSTPVEAEPIDPIAAGAEVSVTRG